MSDEASRLPRREFLAAGGLSTYALLVSARDAGGVEGPAPGPEELTAAGPGLAPPPGAQQRARSFEGEPHMELVDLKCDLLVAGGGPSGVCAALAAAREGARVVLVQDRSRLGGNSSSEIRMHIVGANSHNGRPGWREGGILEELRLDDAANNPQRSFEMWDLLLYDKVVSEPNCTLLLDTAVFAAEVEGGRIQRVMARCDKTEHVYRIRAKFYADCTGDARLALEAGATIRWGHDSREEYGEPLAWDAPSRATLGSSILFMARDHGRPMPYRAPQWARKIEERHLKHRGISSWEYGYWWIEWGGEHDTIRDNERIRFELLSIVTGVWNHIKNSGKFPSAETWALEWVGMVPGKRESRRIVGDHVLTQHDLTGKNGSLFDAVAIGGWGLDEHPPGGFDATSEKPFTSIPVPDVYDIPLRSLYSKDVANLFMAGRNASCSHVAFTSTRVMGTCAVMGQAAGTAAALCSRHGITPRELVQDTPRLKELQQTLLRHDQTIKNVGNEDPLDLARHAEVTSSFVYRTARPEAVVDGFVRDMYSEWNHRWIGTMTNDGAWLELGWPTPQRIGKVQLTFDTGFQRELTLSGSNHVMGRTIRGPQPECVRDYRLVVRTPAGELVEVARVEGNHQRLRRHEFKPLDAAAVRLEITATNGSEQARVYEVRCYG